MGNKIFPMVDKARYERLSPEDQAYVQGKAMAAIEQREVREFVLPAGVICRRNGIPLELAADTVIRCHPDNWPLIRGEFVPEVSEPA